MNFLKKIKIKIMKTLLYKTLLIVAVITLISLLSTCKKETDCKAIVTVKFYHDTTLVVPDADVVISKGDKREEGKSNSAGVFEATFKLEAILDIYAEKDTATQVYNPAPPPLTGAAVIRLKPGETVYKTVFIQ